MTFGGKYPRFYCVVACLGSVFIYCLVDKISTNTIFLQRGSFVELNIEKQDQLSKRGDPV